MSLIALAYFRISSSSKKYLYDLKSISLYIFMLHLLSFSSSVINGFSLSVAKFNWINSKSIIRRKKIGVPRKQNDIQINVAHDLCNKNAKSLTAVSSNFNGFAFSTIYIWSVNYRPNIIIGLISDDSDRNNDVRRAHISEIKQLSPIYTFPSLPFN